MATKRQSLQRLSKIISHHASVQTGMLYRNSFASACYFSLQGKPAACNKLLYSLFDQLGWSGRKKYFRDIRGSIYDFAEKYAMEISANSELNRLF